jgi:type I restriction enzyme S subunit
MTSERATRPTRIGWLQGLSLPAEWTESKVKYVAPGMQAGEAITAESIEPSGTYPVYGGNGLRGYTESKTHRGTRILIGRQGALCGNVHLVSGEFWASEHAIVARAAEVADPRWLAHLLQVMNLGQYSQTAAQPGIGTAQVNALPVPLPPLEEQRAIADYLDHETARIDTLIDEQQRLIEMLRERRSAAVEEAVAAVQTTGQRLKHIIRSVRQGWSPQCYAWPADGVETWAVLKTGAANGGVFRPMENKELPETEVPRPEITVRRGDLIVSRANTRDLVGSAAAVDGDFPRLMLCDKLYAFTLDETQALPRFVAAVLGSRRWRDMIELEATGASYSMLNVSQSDIVNLPMPLPALNDQHQILSRLDEQTAKIDVLITETERFIEFARERRSALITAAVTGQTDVREMA